MPARIVVCERCGRKPSVGFNVPHSQHRTKRLFKANIQKVSITGETHWLCTRCLPLFTQESQLVPTP